MTRPGNAADMRRRVDERLGAAREKLGGQCATCGTGGDLQFDHINPETKTANVTSIAKARAEAFWAEVDKCQLLCTPCHQAKTNSERPGWRHGTIHGYYNRRCRCGECKAAYSTWRKAQRAKTKVLKLTR